MNIVSVEPFSAVGREARTTNAREMSGRGVIGGMWSSGLPADSPIIAVYCEYESDKDGEYSYLLGTKLGKEEAVPRELAHRQVEAGQYLRLGFAGSVSPEATVGLWMQVWDLERDGKLQRAYKTDFEIYSGHGLELYVGVKA